MKKGLISLLMVLLAIPAMAFEVPMDGDSKLNIYGSIRMAAYYDAATTNSGATGAEDVTVDQLHYLMQGNSRFGFNFKMGGFMGNVETGFVPNPGTGTLGFRQLWGGYQFENGLNVKVGQQTNIAEGHLTISDMFWTDNGLAGYGAAASKRSPMIKVGFMGATLAIIDNTNGGVAGTVGGLALDADAQFLPRLELAYGMKFDMASFKVFGAYEVRSYNDANNAIYNLTGATVGAYGDYKVAGVTIKLTAFWAMNGAMNGTAQSLTANGEATDSSLLAATFDATEGKFNNTTSIGVAGEVGYMFNPMFGAIVGGGFQTNSNEGWGVDNKGINTFAVFAQLPIKFNKYFSVKPNVGNYSGS